jgi:hypothetical protein
MTIAQRPGCTAKTLLKPADKVKTICNSMNHLLHLYIMQFSSSLFLRKNYAISFIKLKKSH